MVEDSYVPGLAGFPEVPIRIYKPSPRTEAIAGLLYIHGGGWQGGDKKMSPKAFLDKGISVVAINYRYVRNGVEEKVEPPVKAPLEDAARALQLVRSKAMEWNLDKTRIGATGGSAACFGRPWPAYFSTCAATASWRWG